MVNQITTTFSSVATQATSVVSSIDTARIATAAKQAFTNLSAAIPAAIKNNIVSIIALVILGAIAITAIKIYNYATKDVALTDPKKPASKKTKRLTKAQRIKISESKEKARVKKEAKAQQAYRAFLAQTKETYQQPTIIQPKEKAAAQTFIKISPELASMRDGRDYRNVVQPKKTYLEALLTR